MYKEKLLPYAVHWGTNSRVQSQAKEEAKWTMKEEAKWTMKEEAKWTMKEEAKWTMKEEAKCTCTMC